MRRFWSKTWNFLIFASDIAHFSLNSYQVLLRVFAGAAPKKICIDHWFENEYSKEVVDLFYFFVTSFTCFVFIIAA